MVFCWHKNQHGCRQNRISVHVMLLQILQYLWKIMGYFFVLLLLNWWTKKCFDSGIQNLRRNIQVTADYLFISNGYLYEATVCKFQKYFPWVRSNKVSFCKILQVLPLNWIISIDCMYYLFCSSRPNPTLFNESRTKKPNSILFYESLP